MLTAGIITLRETLEASLVVGIVLSYLHVNSLWSQRRWVWYGVWAGIAGSAVIAMLAQWLLGGFEGAAEEMYEGVIMLSAAGLISWMIAWMLQQRRQIRQQIEARVEQHVEQNYPLGIFLLVLFSVLREGVETILFLQAAYLQAGSSSGQLTGAVLGIVAALLIALGFFRAMGSLSMQRCFQITTSLLLLFAAGLFAHGVHELQEAGVIPVLIEHVWDTNGLLNEDGTIGGLAKGLFGYNGNPSLLEVLSYLLYFAGIGWYWRRHQQG